MTYEYLIHTVALSCAKIGSATFCPYSVERWINRRSHQKIVAHSAETLKGDTVVANSCKDVGSLELETVPRFQREL